MKPKETRKVIGMVITSLVLNVALVFCIAALTFKFQDKTRKISPDKAATIAMVGNSLTKHGEWGTLLGREDVANEGVGGFTTSHFVWLIPTSVIEKKPKICFIEGGSIDLSAGIPLEKTIENIITIIDTLQQYAIIPVLTSTIYTHRDTLTNIRIDSLNMLVKEIARQRNVQYFDLNDKLATNHFLKTEYTRDGIHLTGKAYPIWAEKMKAILAAHKL